MIQNYLNCLTSMTKREVRVCESFSVNRILRSSMIKYKIIGGLILWQEKKTGTKSTND